MAQATLSDMTTQPTPNTDVEQAIDWVVQDSIATAYLCLGDHLALYSEYDAIEQSEVAL